MAQILVPCFRRFINKDQAADGETQDGSVEGGVWSQALVRTRS